LRRGRTTNRTRPHASVRRMHCHEPTSQPAGLAEMKLSKRPTVSLPVAVIVARHDDRRLLVARQVPESRQRLAVGCHDPDDVREQALQLVGLRGSRPSRESIQSDWAPPIEEVVGPDRAGLPVALLPRPGRVALARLDDRAREVERERCRLSACPPVGPTSRTVTAGLPVGVEASAYSAATLVAPFSDHVLAAPVILHRPPHDAGARRPGRVDPGRYPSLIGAPALTRPSSDASCGPRRLAIRFPRPRASPSRSRQVHGDRPNATFSGLARRWPRRLGRDHRFTLWLAYRHSIRVL